MSIEEKETPETLLGTELPVSAKRKSQLARRTLTTFGRIALGASIAGAISGTGGVIGIRLGTGLFSQDLFITTICWIASALILSTKFRWASGLNILIAGYLLFRIFAEPYVMESLDNPYGPDGGIGKFIGMVFTTAFAILVLLGSIDSVIQNYRQKRRQTARWLPAALTLVAGMVIGALFIGLISHPPTASTGTQYTNGVPTVHMDAVGFLQSSVVITKGSKLLLVNDTSIEHDLYNGIWQNGEPQIEQEPGAPAVNNIQLSSSSATIGPFATAGTYHIFCSIHRGMELTVIVQ